MPSRKVIAMVIGTHMTCYREILRGVNAFANAKGTWHLDLYAISTRFQDPIRETKADGLLVGLVDRNENLTAAVSSVRYTVGVCGQHSSSGLPGLVEVESDDAAVGRLGAQHFLQKGYQHFAFLSTHAVWSHLRWSGFSQVLKDAGFEPELLVDQPPVDAAGKPIEGKRVENLMHRIAAMPKPLAVMVCNDSRGRELLESCRDGGISVPDEVAILGVDNDDLDCELSHPPLSSIAIPWQRIGFEAATLLDRLMQGEALEPGIYPVPPIGVVERQSTDTVAISDPEVSAAIRFIREHAHEPINVEAILRAVPAARRSLEKRFRALLGRSPLEEIRRVHVERAKQLLATTDLSMPDVAQASGFGGAAWFSKAFRDLVGEPPVSYRKRFRKQ